MTANEEVLKSRVGEDYELLTRCWRPYALVYNPLKVGSIDGTDIVPHDRGVVRAQQVDYRPSSKVKGKPESTIFVSRLSPTTSEETLKQVFSKYGVIKRCRLVEDIVTGRSKCYAFIEYDSERSALSAYKRAFKLCLDGNDIVVDMECQRLLPGWVPRRLGGGFCGLKESGQLRFGCRYRPFKKPIDLLTERDTKVIESTLRAITSKDQHSTNGHENKRTRR